MSKPENVVELLRDLVAIPSVNPSGDPGTTQINEQGMANYLVTYLKGLGADVETHAIYPHRPNVVGSWKPKGRVKSHLWFAPHTDTVSVLGMTISPFDPIVKKGKLFGRGATDTKGPMAAMLWALKQWVGSPSWQKAGVQINFVGLMGEEAGNEGAIALTKRKIKADFVVVGEPTDLQVIYAHKGACWLELTSQGKACHSSIPDRGVNAIYPMARAITVIEEKVIPQLKKYPHPALGTATMNVGTIQGGSKVNIVPDSCRVELDIRTVPTFDERRAFDFICTEVARHTRDVKIKIQRSAPPLDNNPNNPWIQKLAHVGQGLNVAPWFCDAAVFARAGIPAVAFGPGSIAQAHTKDEFIRLRDLEQGTATYLKFLQSL
jgi:acetylornithine deacetylase/succinyl-diaminopimelate desuccinylase family protein